MTVTGSNRIEYPDMIADDLGLDFETSTLDAFCSGYAKALLWVDAYHYVPTTGNLSIFEYPGNSEMLERDEDAAYAYDAPGRWWEGMGIDFTDAVSFFAENWESLRSVGGDWSQHGHDFLLTRNHHGAGFWDRGYPDNISTQLTENATAYDAHQVFTDDSSRVTTL